MYIRATGLSFTDPCKPEVRPGAREELVLPCAHNILHIIGIKHKRRIQIGAIKTFEFMA